jgi:predicted TIM-barrel fold metal-dependent hydrolase
MTDWNFFDARCKVGRHVRQTTDERSPFSHEHLLDEMDHFGVAESLIVDCLSIENSPLDGNPRILAAARTSPRLHPAWVALPPGSNETPPPDEMLRQMREHKVAAVYVLPVQYRFCLSDWCIDELLEPLADAGVPVIISYEEVGPTIDGNDNMDWDAIVGMCRRWPKLPVIITARRIRRSQRAMYKALDACENLRLELSPYWLHHGIEYITRRWSSERMVFGSNWPTWGHGMTLATVACAQIDDRDKRNIAGDNMRKLIRWCEPAHPHVATSAPADKLVHWGRTGEKPNGITLYDNHGHVGATSGHYHVPDGDAEALVREMDRFAIEKICVFSLSGVFTDEQYGNDRAIEFVNQCPDRFIGFTLLNPHRGPDFMRRELERCANAGMRGVKLIPSYQGYPEEGENIDVACQWAHERKQFILNHHWGGPEQMRRLVSTYTNACFFTGHTTVAYADTMKQYDNLYVCSCPVLEPRTVETVVDAIGADRFLFGSDLSDLPIAWGIGPILFARISEADKRKILGENLKDLLERYSLTP